ncbi:uncharacterized protein LOC129843474 [Salvelinus fontinalis]|uniref:uncharacterized protein LOC129843465 n=1 Tax=Salvelinus fontinalis TaxID=8038 RepID=UPI0024867BC5|nr:uncharacterized protein LOC129843465 [Salvelinus fontinalis]XP_055768185.1 uncharacterized protein LOC129843474 [Salvelinus fontinalis]
MKVFISRTTKKPFRAQKKRNKAYSTFIYKIRREGDGIPTMDCLLVNQSTCPRRVLVRLVGSEAARLSRLNRRKVITQLEVHTAMARLRQSRKHVRQPGA